MQPAVHEAACTSKHGRLPRAARLLLLSQHSQLLVRFSQARARVRQLLRGGGRLCSAGGEIRLELSGRGNQVIQLLPELISFGAQTVHVSLKTATQRLAGLRIGSALARARQAVRRS